MSNRLKRLKRLLTNDEINEILTEIVEVNLAIPEEIEKARIERIRLSLIKQFSNLPVYPEVIPVLKKEMKKMYINAMINPGESVGTLAATFIGEIQTQMTLNTFHFAGLSTFSIAKGVPRVLEILNVTKNIKQPSVTLTFNKNGDNEEYDVKTKYKLSRQLKSIFLSDLMIENNINDIEYYRKLTDLETEWYNLYFDFYCSEIKDDWESDGGKFTWSVRLKFDIKKLYEYSITLLEIASSIELFRDLYCVVSPDGVGIIDIYPDISEITLPNITDSDGNDLCPHIIEENKAYFYIIDTIIPFLDNFKIRGIDNIDEIHFRQEGSDWIVQTEGSNLRDLFNNANDILDYTKLISTDVWETYQILGIEAARTLIIKELINLLEFGGYINPTWLRMVADCMTHYGKLTSINRHGTATDTDPFAIASNEMPFDTLIGSIDKIDNLECVSSTILTGKLCKLGTGSFDVLLNTDLIKGDEKDGKYEKYDLLKCLERGGKEQVKKKEEKEEKEKIDEENQENDLKISTSPNFENEFSSDSDGSDLTLSPVVKSDKSIKKKRVIFE